MKHQAPKSGYWLCWLCIFTFFIIGFGFGLSANLTITRKFYSAPRVEVTSKDEPISKWSIGIEKSN